MVKINLKRNLAVVALLWLVSHFGYIYFDMFSKTIQQAREDYFWKVLQKENAKTGAEIGVWQGEFAELMLNNWTKCEKYYLIDPWSVQKNYIEPKNDELLEGEKIYQIAKEKLKPWEEKTTFLKMRSDEAASEIPDESLDFVYIDGRHDYCATKLDIELYWPKVRPGGMLSGHDYLWFQFLSDWIFVYFFDVDWSICENGLREYGNVKRAVDEFVKAKNLDVVMTSDFMHIAGSWIVRKPFK